jgi:hypothetical protein
VQFIVNKGEDCATFFADYLVVERKVLVIATLGFNDVCLHFPMALAAFPNVDFLFLVEERPEVSLILRQAAERNRDALLAKLDTKRVRFESVTIVAEDTANVAGRRAAQVCLPLLRSGYSDIFVDASAMSRGVCFPVVKQAVEMAKRAGASNAHVVVAGRNKSSLKAASTSSDAPQYVHGFQADMDTYDVREAIKLWIPQLSENATASLSRIERVLEPEETCPILPFPSWDPLRGDKLLREFQMLILGDWNVNLLDVIYAHEADPTDVCETIIRIHKGRADALGASTTRPTRTVLSPAGTRIGSVGMLLAALELDLPIMYEESIGYTSTVSSIPALSENPPDHLWHVWLIP